MWCGVCPGEYTCKVTDWNQTEVRATHVHVIPVPHMEVTPMAATLAPGSPLAITCMSRDDELAKFRYVWERDGKELSAGPNEEVVEQLLPTGTRLSMARVRQSAVYKCTIVSQAGMVDDTAYISVINSQSPIVECQRV